MNEELKKAIEAKDEERVCFLLMQPEFNKKAIKQYYLFHKVVAFGRLKPVLKMKEVINKNIDFAWEPNRRNRMGRTLLQEAVASGNKDIVEVVLSLTENVMNTDREGKSILEDAKPFPEVYQMIAKKVPQEVLKQTQASGEKTPKASLKPAPAVVSEEKPLVEPAPAVVSEEQRVPQEAENKSAPKNRILEDGITALRMGNVKLFGDFLKRYQDDLNAISMKNGETLSSYAYWLALKNLNTGCFALLMSNKDVQLPRNATPEELYRLSILERNKQLLETLVERKVVLKEEKPYHKRLEFFSKETVSQGALKVLSGKAFYEFFELDHDPEFLARKDKLGNTLLHTAVKSGQVYKAQYILNRYPWMLNTPGFKNRTPLHALLKTKMPDETRKKMLEFLLSKKELDVNAPADCDVRPLDVAYEHYVPEDMIDMLKKRGAKATFYVRAPVRLASQKVPKNNTEGRPFGR